jgi:hypothetical protein
MIKLLFFAVLCVALYEPVQSKVKEEVSKGGYRLLIDIDSSRCCTDVCLGSRNSKKISNAVLAIIHSNGQPYKVFKDLNLLDLLYGSLTYPKWAEHIKSIRSDLKGFKRLQRYVNRYKVCKKVCKVLFKLRKAIRNHAADDAVFEQGFTADGYKIVRITSQLIVLSDVVDEINTLLDENPTIVEFQFSADTFIADVSLKRKIWHGKIVGVNTKTVVIPRNIIWDVRGLNGK